MRERELNKRYFYEFFLGMTLYALILIISLRYVSSLTPGWPATLLHVSPMLGFILVGRSIFRWYRGADEYQRQFALENFAIAAAATAVVTFTYGFLENAGLPKLSMFIVWPLMGAALLAAYLARAVLKR